MTHSHRFRDSRNDLLDRCRRRVLRVRRLPAPARRVAPVREPPRREAPHGADRFSARGGVQRSGRHRGEGSERARVAVPARQARDRHRL